MMFAVIIDQHDSRHQQDRVSHLLGLLAGSEAVLDFERAAGDEVQALFADPLRALEAAMVAVRDGQWSVGIGVGAVHTPLPASTREAAGDAYLAARDAVEHAKTRTGVRLAVHAPDGSGLADLAAGADGVARVIATQVAERSTAEWRVIDAVLSGPTASMSAVAKTLGISQPAVSKSLARSHYKDVAAALPGAATLLTVIQSEGR